MNSGDVQPGCMLGWGKDALPAKPRSFEWRNYKTRFKCFVRGGSGGSRS